MKALFYLTFLTLSLNVFAQDKIRLWTQEPYRAGRVLSFERVTNGELSYEASNLKIRNFVFNHFIEEDIAYARVDLSLMQLVLFNSEVNRHWSYNVTLGAFLNETPIKLGSNINSYIGLGADFDLTNTDIVINGVKETDFSTGTIGLNIRYDIEFGDWILLQNSFTRGWWKSASAVKYDYRALIGIKIIDGLYFTISPNYLFHSKIDDGDVNSLREEKAWHFNINYGVGITI